MSQIKNIILKEVSRKCLGNSKRGLKELASDFLNELGKGELDNIASGTFLNKKTVERVMECDENYKPRADTLERCIKYVGGELTMERVAIKPRFRNQSKGEE